LPIAAKITAGEVSDYSGFDPLMEAEGPQAKVLLADRGYDSDHIRETLEEKGRRLSFRHAGTARFKSLSMVTSMPCAIASSAASTS
jgi:IS5 family transposase